MKRLIALLTFLIIWKSISAQEFRGGVSADFTLLPRLSTELEVEIRKAFYPENYFNRTFQGELSYDVLDSWSVGVLYGFSIIKHNREFSDEAGEESRDRNKFAFNVEFKPKRFNNDLRLSNRFRYQYAIVDDDEPKQYFRNKITLDYKISDKMNPYVAIEPYYRLSSNRISVIRIYLGNEMPVFKIGMELYYITEIKLREEYATTQYIVGLKIKLDYKR